MSALLVLLLAFTDPEDFVLQFFALADVADDGGDAGDDFFVVEQ